MKAFAKATILTTALLWANLGMAQNSNQSIEETMNQMLPFMEKNAKNDGKRSI